MQERTGPRRPWLGLWLCSSYLRHPPTALVFDPPLRFRGACETGPGWDAKACNNKVVGARFYIDGFLSRWQLDPGEVRSPKDVDGHGTHIATIAAGNPVDASLLGTRLARVSGIAPRAQVAVYKACWLQPGATRGTCATSDLTRAIDDAVADGVDIINYSVGSLETDLTTPDDMALLHALDAGVLTVVAGGNDGPNLYTIGSPSSDPWVLTTAASTQSGELFDDAIEITAPTDLKQTIVMREATFTPALTRDEPIEASLVTADDGQGPIQGGARGSVRDACQALTNDKDMQGQRRADRARRLRVRRQDRERGSRRRRRGRRVQQRGRADRHEQQRHDRRAHPCRHDRQRGWPEARRPPGRRCGQEPGGGGPRDGQARVRNLRLALRQRQRRGRFLVARPVAVRRELLEARRLGAGRRHPGRPDARRRQWLARRDLPVHVRNVAIGARDHRRGRALEGSASGLDAGHAEVGFDDHGLSGRGPRGRHAGRSVRRRRRPHRSESRDRPRPHVRERLPRLRRVSVRPAQTSVHDQRVRRARSGRLLELGHGPESAVDRPGPADHRRHRAPARHEHRPAGHVHGRRHAAAERRRVRGAAVADADDGSKRGLHGALRRPWHRSRRVEFRPAHVVRRRHVSASRARSPCRP